MRFRATILAATCGVLVFSSGAFASDGSAAGSVPSEHATVSASSLGERLVAQNPRLVEELLRGIANSTEDSESVWHFSVALYTLGGKAALDVIPFIHSDDTQLRSAALQSLTILMAHDDFPTETIMPHLLELIASGNKDQAELGRYLVASVIKHSVPEHRIRMQQTVRESLMNPE